MSVIFLSLIQSLYSLLLKFYPADFQNEFSDEMIQVFQDASRQAQQLGFQQLLVFLAKEMFDLPGSILHEHAWVLFRKEVHMSDIVDLNSSEGGLSASLGFSKPPVSWRESLLAALPFLVIALTGLMTLLSGLGVAPADSPFLRILSPVLAIALFGVALGIFIFSWQKRWPRWTASWYIFWLIAAMVPLSFLSSLTDLSAIFDIFIQPLLWALILLAIAWLLYRLACQDVVKSILAALPVMGMTWFLHQEFVRDDLEGTITLLGWLLVAVSAVMVLRLNNLRAGVVLALGTNILIGLAYAFEGIYYGGTLNFDAPGANWIQVLRSFLPHWVGISTLVLGPLLARAIRETGYRIQMAGLWMYRLALAGLLVLIIGNVITVMIYTNDDLRKSLQGEEPVLNAMTWLGLVVFLVGYILLSRRALQTEALQSWWRLVVLGLCSLYVPFALIMGLLSSASLSLPFFYYPALTGLHDLSPVKQFPELWSAVLGVFWVIVASWLAISLNTPKPAAKTSSQ